MLSPEMGRGPRPDRIRGPLILNIRHTQNIRHTRRIQEDRHAALSVYPPDNGRAMRH